MTFLAHRVDLDSYLQRIGWRGVPTPTLAASRQLAAAHAVVIPFENSNPFLGSRVSLDPAAVERQMVHDGRGGYCFEQNLLFCQALAAIGFEVSGLAPAFFGCSRRMRSRLAATCSCVSSRTTRPFWPM